MGTGLCFVGGSEHIMVRRGREKICPSQPSEEDLHENEQPRWVCACSASGSGHCVPPVRRPEGCWYRCTLKGGRYTGVGDAPSPSGVAVSQLPTAVCRLPRSRPLQAAPYPPVGQGTL